MGWDASPSERAGGASISKRYQVEVISKYSFANCDHENHGLKIVSRTASVCSCSTFLLVTTLILLADEILVSFE